jgi:tetratricopeptide (TPR) repeat protein
MTNRSHSTAFSRRFRLFAGAIAMALPSLALAQGQIDAGRANDASNQVGAAGRNGGNLGVGYSQHNYQINNGNRIVTGNVSQGREFHGTVPYSDPSAFRGTAVGIGNDNFSKNSVGVPHANAPDPVPNTSVPFYGTAQTVAPPQGFKLNANRSGYVPPAANAGLRAEQDQRIGMIDLNQPITPGPVPGDMLLRGSLGGPQGAQQAGVLTGSALYGVREWNPQDPADRVFLENILNRQSGALNRVQMDPREVQRMRSEIEKALQPNQGQPQQQEPNQQGDLKPNDRPQDNVTPNPIGRSFDTPGSAAMTNRPINDQLQNQPLGGGGVNTDQGQRYNVLGAARRTSTQYAELNKRLEQYNADRPKNDADYAREFNAEFKAKRDADKAAAAAKNKGTAGNNDLATRPRVPGGNDATVPGANTDIPKPKKAPLKIETLSKGVVGEGLGNVLKKAEALMKEGKYASALDQYDAAEAVTPSNPLIWLGRANAELGAGFYTRAEAHLKQAFMTDQALLMGQYDLTNMIGEDRLTKLVADLKELANKNSTQATPVFLLGYIAYNTGHEPQALAYLDLAEKRAPGEAGFYKAIRDHWALPETPKPATDGAATPTPETKQPELNK